MNMTKKIKNKKSPFSLVATADGEKAMEFMNGIYKVGREFYGDYDVEDDRVRAAVTLICAARSILLGGDFAGHGKAANEKTFTSCVKLSKEMITREMMQEIFAKDMN